MALEAKRTSFVRGIRYNHKEEDDDDNKVSRVFPDSHQINGVDSKNNYPWIG